jgi:hypothetical protein
MPIRQPKRVSTVDNLAIGKKIQGETLQVAGLFPINNRGEIEISEVGIFMLNPTSWQENKSVNWAEQTVPGQSDPVLQFISGGARAVSFEALVTADTSDFISGQKKQPGKETDPLKQATNFVGSIAAQFFKVPAPAPRIEVDSDRGDNLDISAYLNYYRSLQYPTYDKSDGPTKLRNSPPILVLANGTAINKLPLGGPGTRISSNHDLWVLVDLQISVTKQLPNLAPMEATVQFKLVQYNVRSFDRNRFLR